MDLDNDVDIYSMRPPKAIDRLIQTDTDQHSDSLSPLPGPASRQVKQ